MASKSIIMAAINAKVSTPSYYRIGLTHDIPERKAYWATQESVTYWVNWTADSLSDAQDIESHFINKGMKGGVGGNLSSSKTVYVYVF
ncbi:MAG TPA: hypothetical protein VGI45_11985 [Terracidiphilus sp.]|jgi:hypothetical protein